jgi:hypothetical protein
LFARASTSSIGADCFALIVCLKLQEVGKRKNISKAARKILEKVATISSHVGHRFLAHMAPFGEEYGSAIDLAQLATDVESREMYCLSNSGIRVLIFHVSCI